ncbi:MAG: hypothetical protein ACRD1X_22205 [Vicinamibacteria bacterium]
MGTLTIFFCVVLATWTLLLFLQTVRQGRLADALDKQAEATDRTKALSDELMSTAREHDRVSAERRVLIESLRTRLEEDIDRERIYNEEYRAKLQAISDKYKEQMTGILEKWQAAKGPNNAVAAVLAKMIADADTDDGTETTRLLLAALHHAWPEHEWAHLVSQNSSNPSRWGRFAIR